MKAAILTLALLPVLSVLPAIAQPGRSADPAAAAARAAAQAQARAQALEAAKATPLEDFKPSALNQPGKRYPEVNSEKRVRTTLRAPNAQSVLLDIGGIQYPMTKGADGVWMGVSAPQDEGFHYYQLQVDGVSVPDPGTLIFYGSSRWGSGIEVPAHDEDFYAMKEVPHGQQREVYFFSKIAKGYLRCYVYTPPDYEKGAKRYPVLYLQHGAGEDEHGWSGQGFASRIMDNLIAAGKAKPFIIVIGNSTIPGTGGGRGAGAPGAGGRGAAPAGAPGAGDLAGRAGAAAPVAAAGAAGAAAGRGGPGGPGGRGMANTPFEHVLVEEMIPFIDATFRTIADQPHRAMAGLSMGGMQTKAITLAHLDTFSHIGIFSGGNIAPTDIQDMAAFKKKVKVVFVSYGSRENGAAGKTAVEALQEGRHQERLLRIPAHRSRVAELAAQPV